MEEFIHLAELAAEAQGQNFLIGVRPMGKGWFAHCDGVEWDGADPDDAVRSVIGTLAKNARQKANLAGADFRTLEKRALDLADTAAYTNEDV